MKVDWKEGAPTKPGAYWVRFEEVPTRQTPGSVWLLAYPSSVFASPVTHHAPADLPEPPEKPPAPGWYICWRRSDPRGCMLAEVRENGEVRSGTTCCLGPWQQFKFGPMLEGDPEAWEGKAGRTLKTRRWRCFGEREIGPAGDRYVCPGCEDCDP